jgi:hypothetical protein
MTEQKLPPGVSRHFNKYRADYTHAYKRYYCGLHKTPSEAYEAMRIDQDKRGFKANPVGRPKKNPD